MNHHPKPSRAFSIGFAIWFTFCALVSITMIGVVIWLILAVISWISRQP